MSARRPVSRVLSGRCRPWMTIPLGRPSPDASRDLPENRRGKAPGPVARPHSPIWSCSRWGLPCRRRYRNRGALLPHRFTLTAQRPKAPRRSVLCGTVPGIAPAGRYPAPSFRGARTFLHHRGKPRRQRPSGRLARALARTARRALSTKPAEDASSSPGRASAVRTAGRKCRQNATQAARAGLLRVDVGLAPGRSGRSRRRRAPGRTARRSTPPALGAGQIAMPSANRRYQSNNSPGSCLRSGATSEWPSTRSGGMSWRVLMSLARATSASICAQLERAIAELVAGIDDLDPDRAGVDVALALPGADAGVPGALLLRHHAIDLAVLVDHVVRADLGLRVAQPAQRLARVRHAGVVQHQDVDLLPGRPVVAIGRWQLFDRQGAGRRRCSLGQLGGRGSVGHGRSGQIPVLVAGATTAGRRSTIMPTPATVAKPPTIICQVTASSRSSAPAATPIIGSSRVKGITWFTG